MRLPTPTYSGVTATVALFLALGGTSYAALTITGGNVRNESLTGSDIKDGTVKSADIANGKLTSSDVKDGSLGSVDFKAGDLPAGPAGPAGATGPAGPQGPAGATKVVARRANLLVPNGGALRKDVYCQAGETAVGGGAGFTGTPITDRVVSYSEPREADQTIPEDGDAVTGWSAGGANASGTPQFLQVTVLCAAP